MAYRSFVVLTLVLTCGSQALAHSLEDVSALLQGSTSSIPLRQDKEKLEAQVEAKWPDLDKVLDQVKESVEDVTQQVGEVMDEADKQIDEFGEQIHQIAGNVGQKVADSLNTVLKFVKAEADKLLEMTMLEKTEFIDSVNKSLALGNATILSAFEKVCSKVITSAWGRWQQFRTLVDMSAKEIEKGLRAAGQVLLADKLAMMSSSAIKSLDDFMSKLQNTDEDLHGIGKKEVGEAQEALFMVNDELNKALEHVVAFVAKYQQIFQEATERISNALITSTEEVDKSFASVQQNVTAISWRVRSSGRELILGVHRVIVDVAKAKDMPAPKWHPVSTPTTSTIDWSSAPGARLPLLAALAALAAGLGAAAGL